MISIQNLKRKTPDILMLLFGIVILLIIPTQIKSSGDNIYGPRFFPYILSLTLIIFSFISIFLKSNIDDIKTKLIKYSNIRVLIILILMISWVFFANIIGFALSTFIFSLSTMIVMGNRKYLQLIIVPVVLTGIIYYVFSELLDIFLPSNMFF